MSATPETPQNTPTSRDVANAAAQLGATITETATKAIDYGLPYLLKTQ